jgi:hypothetical protein
MPEEPEIETNELRESIAELEEEMGEERADRDRDNRWTRYIALSTALLAVFAAMGALQSGALVNEAMIDQLKASDTWSEYQASRTKAYFFTGQATDLLDRGVVATAPPASAGMTPAALPPGSRLADLLARIAKEDKKQDPLREKAADLEKEAGHLLHRHHLFAWSVALIQVAIALSAIAALTKIRPVWMFSLLIGAGGIALVVMGLLAG